MLEALAPTTERDFDRLPPEKQALYQAIQQTHLQASPDGPWFFIIARSQPDRQTWQLLGITDTSMLRPQVFALYEGDAGDQGPGVQIGLVASERQAINACLRSLAGEDARFQPLADKYWVARGGSHTDGGAFVFSVSGEGQDCRLAVHDKFGRPVGVPQPDHSLRRPTAGDSAAALCDSVTESLPRGAEHWFAESREALAAVGLPQVGEWLDWLAELGSKDDARRAYAIEILTLLRDRRYDPGGKKRSALLARVDETLVRVLQAAPGMD